MKGRRKMSARTEPSVILEKVKSGMGFSMKKEQVLNPNGSKTHPAPHQS